MKYVKLLLIVLFLTAIIEIIAEYFRVSILIQILKPLFFILLFVLYYVSSSIRSVWFLISMLTIALATLFFSLSSLQWIILGSYIYIIHRIILLIYIYKMMNIKDIVPTLLASLPFLILFFYIFIEAKMINDSVFYVIIVNNFLISFLGGIALSNYIMNENNRSSWLMICVLLFVSHNFIVFIERMYFTLPILRVIALVIHTFAYYTFYKFAMSIEINKNVEIQKLTVKE